MKYLTLISFVAFLVLYALLCYSDSTLLGEVKRFENFFISAILALVLFCVTLLLYKERRPKL